MSEQKGRVLLGINRIYTVLTDDKKQYECRIKGKVLNDDKQRYNPLAAGDYVLFEPDLHQDDKGMIISRVQRDNSFIRFNRKRNSPQIIAANFDLVVCVASAKSPPFRPRFVDRVIASTPDNAKIIIVLNKSDQEIDSLTKERMENYKSLGYQTHLCSAKNGDGVDELIDILKDKESVFLGQSGVGKSTLLNLVRPDINQKTADVSIKHNRGRHTTCFAVMFPSISLPIVTDTPGIREIDVYGIEPEDLYHYFREMNKLQGECSFNKCLHINEPGCAVIKAVKEGDINADRYLSYSNLLNDIIKRRDIDEYR